LFAPVSGEVLEVNTALAEKPELVNSAPYSDAWMVKVRMSDPAELDTLLDAQAYEQLIADEGH
ncbi:MAG: glycine cleavage system protein H, partial [Chloroflexi bacterium]|nr:glycine cleavage system protein H [Chloroflexota bacterium]